MDVQARRDVVDRPVSRRKSSRVAFASIWAYALASGLVAVGVSEVIASLTPPSRLRTSLQLATIPVVAVLAGLGCQRALVRLRAFVAHNHG
jgi:hypothetical protein